MAANEVRSFHVVGSSSDFASQGGVAGGCGIPGFSLGLPIVRAVLINLVAGDPAGGGNLKACATDKAETGGGVVNYQALSPNMNNSNAVVVEVRQDSEGSDINIRANQRGVDVRGIALGYFPSHSPEYRQTFIFSNITEDSQCNQWETFTAGLAGQTFSRITLASSLGQIVSCGDATAVASIVSALLNLTDMSVACDGNNWNIDDNCGGSSPAIDVDAASTNLCSCGSDMAIAPCIDDAFWGANDNNACGPPPSQQLTLRLER